MTVQTRAGALFQTAYESCYTWDENFPGYSADLQLLQDNTVYTGKIRINPDLSLEVTEVADKQVEEGIYIQLQEVITHCKPSDFRQSYGKFEFTLDETDEASVFKILAKSDSVNSYYTLQDQKISQEIRMMARMAVVIDTHEYLDTGAGYIPSRYDVTFRNSKTNEVNSLLKFADTYEKVGEYYIMIRQVVQDYSCSLSLSNEALTLGVSSPRTETPSVTEFSYHNIRLLKPATV